MTTRLMRSRTDRKIAGVAAGLAQHFGIDPIIVRLVFVLALLAPHSPALLVYIILWVVMPEAPAASEQPHRYDPYTGQPVQ